MSFSKIFIWFLCLIFGLFIFQNRVSAINEELRASGVGETRVEADHHLSAGEDYLFKTLSVVNTGGVVTTYDLVINSEFSDSENIPDPDWFIIEPDKITLNPGEAAKVNVYIIIPPFADVGSYETFLEAVPDHDFNEDPNIRVAGTMLMFSVEDQNQAISFIFYFWSIFSSLHFLLKIFIVAILLLVMIFLYWLISKKIKTGSLLGLISLFFISALYLVLVMQFFKSEGKVAGDRRTISFSQVISLCGDSIISGNEDCESKDLNGESCESLGYSSGKLKCKSNCEFNVSKCVAPTPTPTTAPIPTTGPTVTPTPIPVTGPDSCSEVCANSGNTGGSCRWNSELCTFSGEINVSAGDQFCPGNWWNDTCCCDLPTPTPTPVSSAQSPTSTPNSSTQSPTSVPTSSPTSTSTIEFTSDLEDEDDEDKTDLIDRRNRRRGGLFSLLFAPVEPTSRTSVSIDEDENEKVEENTEIGVIERINIFFRRLTGREEKKEEILEDSIKDENLLEDEKEQSLSRVEASMTVLPENLSVYDADEDNQIDREHLDKVSSDWVDNWTKHQEEKVSYVEVFIKGEIEEDPDIELCDFDNNRICNLIDLSIMLSRIELE